MDSGRDVSGISVALVSLPEAPMGVADEQQDAPVSRPKHQPSYGSRAFTGYECERKNSGFIWSWRGRNRFSERVGARIWKWGCGIATSVLGTPSSKGGGADQSEFDTLSHRNGARSLTALRSTYELGTLCVWEYRIPS